MSRSYVRIGYVVATAMGRPLGTRSGYGNVLFATRNAELFSDIGDARAAIDSTMTYMLGSGREELTKVSHFHLIPVGQVT